MSIDTEISRINGPGKSGKLVADSTDVDIDELIHPSNYRMTQTN